MPDLEEASWDGHKSNTTDALIDLLVDAQTGRTRFSQAQRAFFTACEFWAASQNASLLSHLGDKVDLHLQAAESSFTIVDLPRAATIIANVRIALARGSLTSVDQAVARIQNSLAEDKEQIDETLETFALRELSAGGPAI